jgi:S-adenosylmethionine-diacylgycerolhomoserine-N-methlytransferase
MTEHAELMDDVYRYQRYIYDFTRKYYLLGRDQLIRELAPKPGARIVEIGCGTARNLIQIARRYPNVRLFGLDASAEMLRTADAAIGRAGLHDRVKLVQAYAEDLTPSLFGESAPFDDAVFSYSLSMIPDWKQALRSASAALGSDGRIHVVDFGDLKGLGPVAEGILRRWLALFHVAPREELLATLENGRLQDEGALKLLMGRYAFIWVSRQSQKVLTV